MLYARGVDMDLLEPYWEIATNLGFAPVPQVPWLHLKHRVHALMIFPEDVEARCFTIRANEHLGFSDVGWPVLGPEVWSIALSNIPVARFRRVLESILAEVVG